MSTKGSSSRVSKDHEKFREWLTTALLKTHWPSWAVCRDERGRKRLARSLGVDVAILEEAARRLEHARLQAGFEPPLGARKSGNAAKLPEIGVRMPPEARDAWYRLAARLHMRPTSLLRGAMHEYLLDGVEPKRLDVRWVVEGKVYNVPAGVRVRGGNLHVIISRGARDAFGVRAERLGVSRHTLLVALMNDVLSGRRIVRRPIDKAAMYADARRYLR